MRSPERPIKISRMATRGAAVPGRTPPDVLGGPRKGKEKKPLVQQLAGNLALRIALAGTALAGAGYGAYQEIPAVHQSIDKWKNGTSIEEKFPIKLEQSSFTPVSETEMDNLWKNTKTVDLENHTFTIGFPVDQATIDKSPNLRMNQELGTYTATPAEIEKLQKQGFKTDTRLSGFSKDTKIYYHYDSTKFDASIINITIAGEKEGEFNPAYTTLRVIFKDKATGKQYGGTISVLYGKPLVNPAPFPTDHHPVYEDGSSIKPDRPILQLTTDLQDWDGKTGYPLPGQKGQIVLGGISDMGPGVDFNTANFLTPSFLINHSTNAIATKQ